MFDFEAIKKRHAVGSPACEDIGDLIAEVNRLRAMQKPVEPDLVPSNPPKPPKTAKK